MDRFFEGEGQEDSEPLSKQAVTLLPFSGGNPGGGSVVSIVAGVVLAIWEFRRENPNSAPDQLISIGRQLDV